jgi:multidrug efflux system membrane fusion protein
LIPERAIGFDQSKAFVYVVGPDAKVAYRPLTLGASVGDKRIALAGLNAGDKVIVDGTQHVRPSMTVAASEAPRDVVSR